MRTHLQLLSQDARAWVHTRTPEILAETDLEVDIAPLRQVVREAGAEINERISRARLPRFLVEENRL